MGVITFLLGIATGAGLMYLFDPDKGKNRRARLKEQIEQRMNSSTESAPEFSAAQRDFVGAHGLARRLLEERNWDNGEGPNAAELRDRAAEEEMAAFTENPESIPSD